MLQAVLMCLLAAVCGAASCAATGVKIGAEAMGNEMAALMGGFFGRSAVLPAAIVAVVIQALR